MQKGYLTVENGGKLNNYQIIKLKGEFDLNEVNYFEKNIEEILKETVKYVILDVTDLEYLDSSGIGCIVRLYRDTEEKRSGKLIIYNPPSFIQELFQISNLHSFLSITSDEKELEQLSKS